MRFKNRLLGLIFTIVITGQLFAQTGVIISTEANQVPHESAMLEIKSNGKGFLIPRMTMLERANIQTPAEGLLVYQTNDVKGFYYYTGSEWTAFVSTSDITNWDIDASNDITTSQVTSIGSGQIITQTERDNWNTIAGVPAGTILPFGGESAKVPEGWLLCNGTAYDKNEYVDLFTIIDFNWGQEGQNYFKVPDFQGQFLRGADLTNPGSAANENRAGGSSTEKIGSIQNDAFQGHWHKHYYKIQAKAAQGNYTSVNHPAYSNSLNDDNSITNPVSDGTHGTPRTSIETRPKNIFVNYIIKY